MYIHTPSIIIDTTITAVRIVDMPFSILNGIVVMPPINPVIVMMLNSTKSVGRSGLKNILLNALSFFKTVTPNLSYVSAKNPIL